MKISPISFHFHLAAPLFNLGTEERRLAKYKEVLITEGPRCEYNLSRT